MENRFEKAIRLMRRAGYDDIADRLTVELETMAAEVYKIAVVGEFKSGKSTLINKIFLQDDVLFTDIMEATAVPTEIRYSRDKYLEIVPYETKKLLRPNPFENGAFELVEETGDEEEPFKIMDPSVEDIKKHTSAESSQERARLAGKISRARLGWPSVHLAGLAVFDTPGINSINEAVISMTYRIIPESDLVLFLTNSRQLSGVEMEFLTGRVISEGIARLMVVVTYDPCIGTLSSRQRKNLLDAVAGQLASIGQASIPVEMVNIRDSADRDEAPKGLKSRIEGGEAGKNSNSKDVRKTVDSVIGGLLGENSLNTDPEAGPVEEDSDKSIGFAALEQKLVRFIRDNVRPARMEKAKGVLQKQLQLAKVRCAAETAALGKSQAERERILESFREKEKKIRQDYEVLSARMLDELQQTRKRTSRELSQGLEKIATSYVDGFDQCDNLGDLQNRLNRSAADLRRKIENLFLKISENVQEQIESLSEKYKVEISDLINSRLDETTRELSIEGGVLANVPPVAILALDFSLFVLFGPFRPLSRVIVRLLANEIPFLNRILPASVAASLLKSKIKSSLTQQFERIKSDTTERIERAFDNVATALVEQLQGHADEQLDSVRVGLEKVVGGDENRQRSSLLTEIKEELDLMETRI